VLSPLASCLRLASIVLCLLAATSFLLFAVDRTGTASAHQQRELNGEIPPPAEAPAAGAAVQEPQGAQSEAGGQPQSKGSARKTLDEVARAVESPFAGLTDNWSSEWLRRSVLLLLSLAVYGFGLSFLARSIRVRA